MQDDDGGWLIRAELLEIRRERWMARAACRGQTDLMLDARGFRFRHATQVCAVCPVKAECLDYALRLPPGPVVGVWGGLSAQQLKRARQQRRAAAA